MFCESCGNSVLDEAYVCPFCGKQLKTFPDEILTELEPRQPSRKFYRLAKIFSIIAIVLSAITLFFGFLFIFMLFSGMSMVGDGGLLLVIYSIFALIAMLGFSPFALIMSILAFVFGKKSIQPVGKLPIVAFVLGILACVIGVGTYLLLVLG